MLCRFPITEKDYDANRDVSERVVRKLRREYGDTFETYFPAAQVIELRKAS